MWYIQITLYPGLQTFLAPTFIGMNRALPALLYPVSFIHSWTCVCEFLVPPTYIPVSRTKEEGPNRVEIRQKPEGRRDEQDCFHSLPHAISITPLPVFVIRSSHCSVSTCCWLYAHKRVPVTHIHKERAPREEVMSCLLRFWKWLVMLTKEASGADGDIWGESDGWNDCRNLCYWWRGRRKWSRRKIVKLNFDIHNVLNIQFNVQIEQLNLTFFL